MNITVSNSSNPSRVYVRLCKHGERFLLLIQTAKSFFSAKNLVISVYRRDDFAFLLWHCFLFFFVLFFLLVDVKMYTKTLRRTYSGVFSEPRLITLALMFIWKKKTSVSCSKKCPNIIVSAPRPTVAQLGKITPCPIAGQKKENMHFHTKRSAFVGGIYTKAASY